MEGDLVAAVRGEVAVDSHAGGLRELRPVLVAAKRRFGFFLSDCVLDYVCFYRDGGL